MIGADRIKRYRASGLDCLMHLARRLHDGQGRCVLTFADPIDRNRLARALQLSMQAEPVLNCRFVPHPLRPFWESPSHLEPVAPLTCEESADRDLIENFLGAPLDASHSPQVQSGLFRGGLDKLVIKMSHEAADGGGILNYLRLLGDIYHQLEKNPAYIPPPGITGRRSKKIFLNQPIANHWRSFFRMGWPKQKTRFPKTSTNEDRPSFTRKELGNERFSLVRNHCRSFGMSVNGALLAAFFSALFQAGISPAGAPLTIQATIDLRHHLSKTYGLGIDNFSGTLYPTFKNQDMMAAMIEMRRFLASARSHRPWLAQAQLIEFIFSFPYSLIRPLVQGAMSGQLKSGKINPFFANFGVLDLASFNFGDAKLCDMDLFGPVPYSPGCILATYCIRGSLRATTCLRKMPGEKKTASFLDAFLHRLEGVGSLAIGRNGGENDL